MATEMITVLVKLEKQDTAAASSDPCSACSMRLLIDWRI
jgi:hypothetical protein